MLGDEPERLARSVLIQAINDAGLRGSSAENLRSVHRLDRAEAISFLTSQSGEWRRARIFWCGIAGRNEDDLRRWAVKKLGMPLEALPEPAPPPPIAPAPPPPIAPAPPPRGPRPGTKFAALVDLLRSPGGTTLDEMQERFGWSRVTCSTAISGDLPYKWGFRSKRGEDGRYRLVEAA